MELGANPTGGLVVSGTATITTLPGTVTINQATTTASINWQDFSIAAGELTRFQVPSSTSATLNRVVGGNMSEIYGTLQSNGKLYLINPNGVVVGASGVVDTAGFLATTLNFSDSQFNQQGNLNLTGTSTAGVSNQGTIHAATGDVYLIASQVNNSGTITAPQGTVGLAAGNSVLLQKAGDQHLFVQVDTTTRPQTTGVSNTGAIRSAAAELKAAGGNAYALAINNTGNIAATGITTINGQVYLTSDGGTITNTGKISAKLANDNGGKIVVDGTGTSPKGNTVVNSGTLDASASVAGGRGGTVTLKNLSGSTIHSGRILAKGGQGGAGGNVEISGNTAQITGTVDTTAPGGLTGNLLIDPLTFTVAASGGDETGATLSSDLDSSNITLQATNTVTIEDNVSWTGSNTLTLETTGAGGTVNITSPISGYALNVFSPNINITGTSVTTTEPGIPDFSQGLVLGGYNNVGGQIDITNSTITGSSMYIGLNIANTDTPVSQVSINNSAINLVLGANPSYSNLQLNISGIALTAGSAGVSITNGSSITAEGDQFSQVDIQGTGLVAANSAAIGVLIDDSTLTSGSAGSPGHVDFHVKGNSDSGTVTAAPATFGSAEAAGLVIDGGSIIKSYSAGKLTLKGHAYADDADDAVGVGISGSTVQVFNSRVDIGGDVRAETLTSGGTVGAAYTVAGVALDNSTITSTGEDPGKGNSISIFGGVKGSQPLATDNGDSAIAPSSYGVNVDDTQITASGNSDVLYVPILIAGEAGAAQSSSSQVATSIGVSISGGSTISNSGEGVTDIAGLGSLESGNAVTGTNVVSDGVQILGTAGTPEVISATGGGSIGIGGLGGQMGSSSGGSADGVDLEYANVSTTSGIVILMAAAGSGGPVADRTGLNLAHSTVQTGLSGSTAIPDGGGVVPPLILIYATDSAATDSGSKHNLTFNLGSALGNAISEDANSKLITENLAMGGDFYNIFEKFATSSFISGAPSLASFNTYVTTGGGSNTIDSQGITLNPPGHINLTSTLNQIGSLDGVLVGSGGFDLYDSSNLVVSTIGANDNQNYGEVDEAGLGPVTITLAPNDNLTLTNVSPITGTVSTQPVIATTGTGSNITLVTQGSGDIILSQSNNGVPVLATTGPGNTITAAVTGTGNFVNTAGATAISVSGGASYAIYAPNPGNLTPDGLTPAQTVYNTNYPGPAVTENTFYYASASPLEGLNGIDYTDSGLTAAPGGTTIDLIFNGTLLGSTTTTGTGSFNFSVSSADLTGGILLTDPTHSGNTYYQANSPLATITGVDIWGDTLRVMANTASNTALGVAAGSLSADGINYSVLASALTSNAGINMIVAPNTNYTVDGDINVSGTLTTDANSVLTTSTPNTTLSAASLALGGSLTSTGAVDFTASASIGTSGAINVGSATFSAPGMTLGGSLTSSGAVNFNATGTITDSGTVDVGSFILQSGTWSQVVGQNGLVTLPAFSAGNFELQGESTFERFAGIDTTNGNADEIADVYGLQGLASPSGTFLGDNAELINNIDATGTASWNGGAGFVPIGSDPPDNGYGGTGPAFTGKFNGQNFTINNLYINTPSASFIGLFGEIDEGTIENVGLTNVQLSGSSFVGGLVGQNTFGTITNAYSEGTESSFGENGSVGGLVGFNQAGTISYAYSTGSVSGSIYVGGLVGQCNSEDTISSSYSTATVTAGSGSSYVGGLVGGNNGAISNSFSTGTVTTGSGSSYVGGLSGSNINSTISDTYTTGTVNAGAESTDVGGLVGDNQGTISDSFWDTGTAGSAIVSGVGSDETPNTTAGVLEATTAQLMSQSYITANAPSWNFSTIWTTYNDSLTPQLIGLPTSGGNPTPNPITITVAASPGNPGNPVQPINNTDNNEDTSTETLLDTVFTEQGNSLTINTDIIPGAGGVASSNDESTGPDLKRKLAKSGKGNIDTLYSTILADIKDGSTVNTGSLGGKLSENTGFSQIVHINEYAQISQGISQGGVTDPVILKLFQQQGRSSILNELSQAAGGH